jgi:hypothetical protein
MRLFGRRQKEIEPLSVDVARGADEASEQDNQPGPDDLTFEELERKEAKRSRHGGFPNFGR